MPKGYNKVFLVLLIIYCLYAGLFIYQSSFSINGERYFCLYEDGMIGMRYAKNLANGDGLIWNPGGEKVEGYTTPLWVVFLSLFHFLPVAASKISLLVQICSAIFLIINLFCVKKISELISNGSPIIMLSAVFITAFYWPLNYWGLSGMEVGALTVIITASIWKAMQCIKLGKFSLWPYALLGIGMLIRTDMVIPFIAVLALSVIADRENRKNHLIFGLSFLVAAIVLQTAFRISYYGDILPNTYYLRVTGIPMFLRMSRGLFMFLKFVLRLNWVLFLVPFVLLLFRREKYLLLPFLVLFLQVLYNIYVGGDSFEGWAKGGLNKFLTIVMPLFIILFCAGLVTLAKIIKEKAHFHERTTNYTVAVIALLCLINFNEIYHVPTSTVKEWSLIKQPRFGLENERNVRIALMLIEMTNPQAKLAVAAAGAAPYFSERYSIDLLGKNDKKIARGESHLLPHVSPWIGFMAGHSKWDFSYSIAKLKPDIVVVGAMPTSWTGINSYLEGDYTKLNFPHKVYVRNGAANIRWDRLDSALTRYR